MKNIITLAIAVASGYGGYLLGELHLADSHLSTASVQTPSTSTPSDHRYVDPLSESAPGHPVLATPHVTSAPTTPIDAYMEAVKLNELTIMYYSVHSGTPKLAEQTIMKWLNASLQKIQPADYSKEAYATEMTRYIEAAKRAQSEFALRQ